MTNIPMFHRLSNKCSIMASGTEAYMITSKYKKSFNLTSSLYSRAFPNDQKTRSKV